MGFARLFKFVLLLCSAVSCMHPVYASIPKKASVMLLEAKSQPLADALTYPGRVRSRLNATTTSEIEGQVTEISRPLGSKVKNGDVILVIRNTDPIYRYAPIRIRSLSSGYLTSFDVALMSRVERGQKLFTITDPKNLLVEVEIPAHHLSALKRGMTGEFRPDPMQPESVPVTIEGLSPLIDVKSGTATAELRPLKESGLLRQGILGQISLKTNQREAFLLPESAIIYRDEKPFVRVLANGKVQRKEIKLGSRMGDSYEVSGGLKAGEQIVTRSSRFISDGEEVEVQKSESK